ncbi:P-loop containing nucleoside triphosphate hydrolase protein [Multifurca ochricompacta]|uniref:P-loop containing nucleoside triphosphate hydrolase protein n=1 Tax=Multifurca ochricompacta TaxID=376703 RepID=A0AAD4M0V1_9AGAM|nr:P-loop containing nucleoside triphosphate hydrolase protein [Multifurca ochricompacta]
MRNGEGFLLIMRVKDMESVPIILVGNKCDLEYERQVDTNEGQRVAHELGCRFVETSAKLGANVTETFLNLVRQIRDHNKRLQMRRISRAMSPDSGIMLPGAGCWNSSGCIVS